MDREELEELWHLRLKNAQLRWHFAKNYAAEVQRDLPSFDSRNVDGQFAMRRAIHTENLAPAEYQRVLTIYKDLVVDGIIPDEREWHRLRAAGEQ